MPEAGQWIKAGLSLIPLFISYLITYFVSSNRTRRGEGFKITCESPELAGVEKFLLVVVLVFFTLNTVFLIISMLRE